MSCGVGGRRGLDPALLWLWCRAAATAPIRPLAWEPPYAAGAAQKRGGPRQTTCLSFGERGESDVLSLSRRAEGRLGDKTPVLKDANNREFLSWLSG